MKKVNWGLVGTVISVIGGAAAVAGSLVGKKEQDQKIAKAVEKALAKKD